MSIWFNNNIEQSAFILMAFSSINTILLYWHYEKVYNRAHSCNEIFKSSLIIVMAIIMLINNKCSSSYVLWKNFTSRNIEIIWTMMWILALKSNCIINIKFAFFWLRCYLILYAISSMLLRNGFEPIFLLHFFEVKHFPQNYDTDTFICRKPSMN